MPNNSGELDYFREVQTILAETLRYVIINDFNPEIWKTVLRTKNTDVVCIPSIMDPFPHTSIEAKLFSGGMDYITIISNADGAVDAFSTNESIYVDPKDTELFSRKIVEAATMECKQRRKIIDKNQETVDKFNFSKILENFIKVNIT
jgi:glycosyltransferase involved in cell wall biosynthesis